MCDKVFADPARAEQDKRVAAAAAVCEVQAGMLVGLGTGSTAAEAIRLIGAARLAIEAVATSEASAALARSVGILVRDFAEVARVDLTIDGADAIDPQFRAMKGAGGAMLREKVVAAASDRMVVIADGRKRVETIAGAKLPVEVLPFARRYVEAALRPMFAEVVAREGQGGLYTTDNGNIVIDCDGAASTDWDRIAAWLGSVPGVAGHGLFLNEVDAAYIADGGVVTRLERRLVTG